MPTVFVNNDPFEFGAIRSNRHGQTLTCSGTTPGITRRQLVAAGTTFAVGSLFQRPMSAGFVSPPGRPAWRMPDEAAPHHCTWMVFGANAEIWKDLLDDVRDNLASVAATIARFETVKMLVRPGERRLAADLCGDRVQLIATTLDDVWVRDTGPTFVQAAAGRLGAVDFNFNGWGDRQDHEADAAVADFITSHSRAEPVKTSLVGEGGGIEVDGAGTAIVTESCFLNDNRNPGVAREAIEAEFRRCLGVRKVIWLPGVRGRDITDGHTDFYARFARPGVVVAGLEMDRQSFDFDVTREHLEILQASTDARGQPLEVVTLESPRRVREELRTPEFAAGYINFYVVNGAVIAPQFGDQTADSKCKDVLQRLFPDRQCVQLNIDAIAAGGGGIHCVTQQQPAATVETP